MTRGVLNFGFAFNDISFSDRVLRIEILSHSSVAGDVASEGNISNRNMDSLIVQRVITFYVSSTILAAQSRYFYELVLKDPDPVHLTLQIKETEEVAIVDLLNYIYCKTLSSTSAPDLVNLLMVADKFGVASCVVYCSNLLCNIPLDTESAIQYLELPSRVRLQAKLEPLTNAAKQFLRARYKDISILRDEAMGLPLAGLEMILSVENLYVGVEDAVFALVFKWAQAHYPEPEERKKILRSRLIPHILSPNMTLDSLTKIFTSTDLDPLHSEVVLEALLFKVGVRNHKCSVFSEACPL